MKSLSLTEVYIFSFIVISLMYFSFKVWYYSTKRCIFFSRFIVALNVVNRTYKNVKRVLYKMLLSVLLMSSWVNLKEILIIIDKYIYYIIRCIYIKILYIVCYMLVHRCYNCCCCYVLSPQTEKFIFLWLSHRNDRRYIIAI